MSMLTTFTQSNGSIFYNGRLFIFFIF